MTERFRHTCHKLLIGIAVLTSTMYLQAQVAQTAPDLVPTGKGWGEAAAHAPQRYSRIGGSKPRSSCTNGICYHGGPLLNSQSGGATTPVNIYYIWYGGWGTGGLPVGPLPSDSSTTVNLLSTFMTGLSGSSYEAINTTYYDGAGTHVTGYLNLAGAAYDNYSQGTSFGDSGVQAIVAAHAGHDLPLDKSGVYFVLTSSDVNETSGFCTQYCGWHTHGTISGLDLKWAFVGNPDRCPSACEAQTTSPNNDSGGDGMANIVAHEQEEAISDPDLNAWYDQRGYENTDKCAWTFGTEYTAGNGSKYNVTLGSNNYLIQQNWLNANGGLCTMSY